MASFRLVVLAKPRLRKRAATAVRLLDRQGQRVDPRRVGEHQAGQVVPVRRDPGLAGLGADLDQRRDLPGQAERPGADQGHAAQLRPGLGGDMAREQRAEGEAAEVVAASRRPAPGRVRPAPPRRPAPGSRPAAAWRFRRGPAGRGRSPAGPAPAPRRCAPSAARSRSRRAAAPAACRPTRGPRPARPCSPSPQGVSNRRAAPSIRANSGLGRFRRPAHHIMHRVTDPNRIRPARIGPPGAAGNPAAILRPRGAAGW